MDEGTKLASQRFVKYLGKEAYKEVKKSLPQFKEPVYSTSMNYMRAGTPVVLPADSSYYQIFPNNSDYLFIHHLFAPYYWLMEKYYLGK